jgi:hypothetical protein
MDATQPNNPTTCERRDRAIAVAEICARYPDQWVCLVDLKMIEFGSPEIRTARVVGHGPTHGAAFDPNRNLHAKYRGHAVWFTGVCTQPLIRPTLLLDDEDLAILAEPVRFVLRHR